MANYCGTGRSNYFKVKNTDKFLKWSKTFDGIEIRPSGRKNEFCVFGNEESGDFPGDPDEFILDIAQHLSKDSVAIFISAGAEKLRYISGWALAINSKGETKEIALDHIYDWAKTLTTKPEKITRAEY